MSDQAKPGGMPSEATDPQPDASAADEAAADAFASAAEDHPEIAPDSDGAAAQVEIDLDLAQTANQRDEYLDALQRLKADFENYKKRVMRQQGESLDRAGEDLVVKLLTVLDTADLARQHGAGEGVDQIANALGDVLAREGLERIDPVGLPFDPNEHEAVAHEDAGAAGGGGPEVSALMRAGYRWKGRLVRPAMVTVRG